MLWAVTALLYPFNCLGFDSCWAKQCLRRVLRARGSPLQMDSRSWGPHMLYSTLCLPIWPLWQQSVLLMGRTLGESKRSIRSWWFPSIILCRWQGRGLYERRRWAAPEQLRQCPQFWISQTQQWVCSIHGLAALQEGENAGQRFLTHNKLEIQQQKKKLYLLHISSKTTCRSYLTECFNLYLATTAAKVKLNSVSAPAASLGNGTALTQMTKFQHTGWFKTNYVDAVKYYVSK